MKRPGRIWLWTTNGLLGSPLISGSIRTALLRRLGVRAGRDAEVRDGVNIWGPDLHIGERSFVNIRVTLNNSARITLGDDVAIGPGALLTTSSHAIGDQDRRQGPLELKPIYVGAGTWIGANATVLPGVTIGEGCIIGAGSVVNRDCEPNGLYAGVPARLVRKLG